MKRLTGLDATFLNLESPEMPMHVGALHLYELPKGFRGSFAAVLRKHMQQRLPLTPPLRRRLWMMPMGITNPVWVDAEPDMAWHVVEHRLAVRRRAASTAEQRVRMQASVGPKRRGSASPEAADLEALEKMVGKLHVELLDRHRPLWRFHVIEGLAPGANGARRVAMVTQLHHAAVDGQAAVALANAILDVEPKPAARDLRASTREKRFRFSLVEMISGAVTSEVRQIAQLIRALPETAGAIGSAAGSAVRRSAIVTGRTRAGSLGLAPRMALNAPVTAARAFAAVTLPLAEAKALGKAHDATLNDVVLWLVSSALRAHYEAKGELPKKSMVAAVPVSLRAAKSRTDEDTKASAAAGNQASITLLSLGTNLDSDRERLAHVKAASRSMKDTLSKVKNVLPTDFPSLGVSWLTGAALAAYRRASDKLPPVANVAISNVPGPPVALYLAGAKMLTNYPCSIVIHGMALNITVQSYDQSLDFGMMADAKAMPDVRKLGKRLARAFERLRRLPVGNDHKPVPSEGERPPRRSVSNATKGRARSTAAARER
jgi:diacylglycerol O-acyltransferase